MFLRSIRGPPQALRRSAQSSTRTSRGGSPRSFALSSNVLQTNSVLSIGTARSAPATTRLLLLSSHALATRRVQDRRTSASSATRATPRRRLLKSPFSRRLTATDAGSTPRRDR
eukprot:Amastigsp_a518597_34.p4 type:complete len:114 gc:universal Amastigsp_a518597_34:264-605(+)